MAPVHVHHAVTKANALDAAIRIPRTRTKRDVHDIEMCSGLLEEFESVEQALFQGDAGGASRLEAARRKVFKFLIRFHAVTDPDRIAPVGFPL